MTTSQLLVVAEERGVAFGELMSMPDKDEWEYPGVKNADGTWLYPPGPAMVCNVFVCRMWKAGGLLAQEIACSEFTPFDTYELALFDSDARDTPGCVDPDGPSCQLLGDYKILLPHANTVAPFAHMRERCPALPPDYQDRLDAAAYC
eukprot:CAMPEP_0181332932 /NCGR_PEP_ID=MMETSP1101-20121128/25381_1 /TAXON_ID=46948 /ORGANISM="Rhodomonas abbreviata, Strain Caron Lab Isolate" /LENGTH=146 /DNA_ID=CAMNT_0023442657 /DNA_START=24 /DNA_END=464 /DNA_ORIENTATION=+